MHEGVQFAHRLGALRRGFSKIDARLLCHRSDPSAKNAALRRGSSTTEAGRMPVRSLILRHNPPHVVPVSYEDQKKSTDVCSKTKVDCPERRSQTELGRLHRHRWRAPPQNLAAQARAPPLEREAARRDALERIPKLMRQRDLPLDEMRSMAAEEQVAASQQLRARSATRSLRPMRSPPGARSGRRPKRGQRGGDLGLASPTGDAR